MKTKNNYFYEDDNKTKRELIKDDLLECFEKIIKGEKIENIIKNHKKYINSLKLLGKKKYKSVGILEFYKNSYEKDLNKAYSNLLCYLNNNNLLKDISFNCKQFEIKNLKEERISKQNKCYE